MHVGCIRVPSSGSWQIEPVQCCAGLVHDNAVALQKIAVRFGSHFMSSLAPGALSAAMPAPGSPADVLRRGMRWADRSFIMEAIDSLESEAVREGARSAYMAFSHCASWEAELRRVEDMLAAPGL